METLRDEIVEPQHWGLSESHMFVGTPAFGLPEFRLLLEGSYTCAGVKMSALEGDTMKEKIEA
eukprot:3078631-Lingulodinium_polyedra.AAC.1